MLLIMLFGSLNLANATPQQLTQQGRLVDSSGLAVNGQHNLTFRLYESGSSSDVLWEETSSVFFSNGYYAVTLGADSANQLEDETLAIYPLYLEVELNNDGPLSPRQQIKSAPYARMAHKAQELSGGSVSATQISIGETLVIDSNGSWVGPTVATAWTQITGIPADLQDGDDDTLANLGCSMGEIPSWGGSSWICSSDATVTESQIRATIEAQSINLAAGSQMNGSNLRTAADESLADLSCLDGDVPKWTSSTGWMCALDDDNTLTQADVEQYVTNAPIDVASGSTMAGQPLMTVPSCADGEILSFDGASSSWSCTAVQQIFDGDGDGVMAWADCDDDDAQAGSSTNDDDCDGILNSEDLDDDGDGQCDENNIDISTDADCDGLLTTEDCDDSDPNALSTAEDADCDGINSVLDCDDNNANNSETIGLSSLCAASSCTDLMDAFSGQDGVYWINDGTSTYQSYCDMSSYGGGWMLAMKATGGTLEYNSPYWTDSNLLNETSLNENEASAKFQSFVSYVGTEILLKSNSGNSTHLELPSSNSLQGIFNLSTQILTYVDGVTTPTLLVNGTSYSFCGEPWRTNTQNGAKIRLGGWVNFVWSCGYGIDEAGQNTGAHLVGFGLRDDNWGPYSYATKSFGIRDAHDENHLNPGQLEAFGMIFIR